VQLDFPRNIWNAANMKNKSHKQVTITHASVPLSGAANELQEAAYPQWIGRFGEARWPQGDGPIAIDLFSGCGGFTLGFKAAGYKVIAAVEIDELAGEIYQSNFPGVVLLNRDIRRLQAKKLLSEAAIEQGRVGVIMGGAPCQGFSYMGSRQTNDPRNKLYKHFVRMIDELRPEAYLFENVPGMMTLNKGQIFRDFIASLEALGYSANHYIINAAAYGIPQMRTRLFVVGTRDKRKITLGSGQRTPKQYVTVAEAFEDLPPSLETLSLNGPFDLPYTKDAESAYARLLRGTSAMAHNCAPTKHTAELRERLSQLGPGDIDAPTKHRRLDPMLPSWTIRAGTRDRTACRPIHPTQPRVISIREAARLSSFPDEMLLPEAKSSAHMLIGNSVPPYLVYQIALQIADQVFLKSLT
jgi:DNA (cytosine-5)-methyltransferase 1